MERRLSWSGVTAGFTAGDYLRTKQLEFVLSLAQGPADPRATGVFKMIDRARNVSIDMKDFGALQVASEWASFTGRTKLHADDAEESVTVIVDRGTLRVIDSAGVTRLTTLP
jgi:hypothetical protein